MHTYQVRFAVDVRVKALRCFAPLSHVDIPETKAISLHFTDTIHLRKMLHRAGLPDEIASMTNPMYTWTVTFVQLSILGYSPRELRSLGIVG
jgi:hypothetical protein